MKQIRSGQSFLYRESGYNSTVLEIQMKDKVIGSYLQRALLKTIKRFPYMSDKLVEKNGSYYLHQDVNSMTVNRTVKYRPLGSITTGYHLLDVTYIGYYIRIAFHHGLCDGRGVMPIVETLLYEYCCLKYNKKFSAEGIHLCGEDIDPAEDAEPFGTEPYTVEAFEEIPSVKGFVLPESTSQPDACYRTRFVVDEAVFVGQARQIGATPSVFTAILLSDCIAKGNPGAEQPIVCNLAMDLRSAIGMEKTHRNCVGSAALPIGEKERALPPTELAKKLRGLLKLQQNPNVIKSMLNRQIELFNKLDTVDNLEEKRKLMSFFNGLVSNTYVISYLGRLRLNDYSDYVESACFYSDTICGLTVNMLSAGGKLSFEFLQGFSEIKYTESFGKSLRNCGLLSVGETEVVVTGKDKSYITASRQAERYYMKPE